MKISSYYDYISRNTSLFLYISIPLLVHFAFHCVFHGVYIIFVLLLPYKTSFFSLKALILLRLLSLSYVHIFVLASIHQTTNLILADLYLLDLNCSLLANGTYLFQASCHTYKTKIPSSLRISVFLLFFQM